MGYTVSSSRNESSHCQLSPVTFGDSVAGSGTPADPLSGLAKVSEPTVGSSESPCPLPALLHPAVES